MGARRLPSLLILGGAKSVLDDAAAARRLGRFDAVLACNDTIAVWPEALDLACSLHPDKLKRWLDQRIEAGGNWPEVWSHFDFLAREPAHVDRYVEEWGGGTGALAIAVGAAKGFDRMVLAGIPMTAAGAHRHAPGRPWRDVEFFRGAWVERLESLRACVRSMSGWTMEVLGAPDAAWIKGKS